MQNPYPIQAKVSTASREVAPFLRSLRRMLFDESNDVLRWTPDGRAFEIHDMQEMTARVLPKYFKHCKYTSFQRQLNYFNFRKWTKSKAVVCTFSNDYFLRDQPELSWRISRKKTLNSYTLPKYRPARTHVIPYWKRAPVLTPHTLSFETVPLTGDFRGRFLFPAIASTDLMLKQHENLCAQPTQQARHYYSFNMAAALPFETYSASKSNETELFDWIDCLLPTMDDSVKSSATPNTVSLRKGIEFVPSTSL
ncbi:hypothetical protein CCR75_006953 [Bremia lactucae]|uniref:HSF-type DNA-binding domain-containing protein n=1 Tax=Bremia lactucae TaxID=4779 RepID=A0A976IK31_BRELC|nr:hypothetical protein CCR75_006953 [Bremia lactucae]